MAIRNATLEDLCEMSNIGMEMHKSSTFADMSYDHEKVKKTLQSLIEESQFVVVSENSSGEIDGAMAGLVEESWFGSDLVATDVALYVKESSRSGFQAFRLVNAFVTWAKIAGAKQIRPGVSTGSGVADAFYERIGFKKCGSNFYMNGGK